MAQYDPQRSRSRHRSGDDEGPAPVDALLGATGSADPSQPPDLPVEPLDLIDLTDAGGSSRPVDGAAAHKGAGGSPWGDSGITPGATRSAPVSPVVLAVAVVAVVVLAWAWLRRRRGRPTPD